jgi:hypothetical protein
MSDGREWGVGMVPSWASKSIPDMNSPTSSLLSLIPKEDPKLHQQILKLKSASTVHHDFTTTTTMKNKSLIPLTRTNNHHDSRIRRWQCKKPPDAEGNFGRITSNFTSSLRNAPDQSIINYHRDLRIAALVKQSVKEQAKNKKEIETVCYL